MKLSDRIIISVLRRLSRRAQRTDRKGLNRIGRFLASFMKLDRKRVAITQNNVSNALSELSSSEVQNVVNGAYKNLGLTLAELLAAPSLTREQLLDQMVIPGIEMVRERHQRGEPSILLSGHYGNWEYLAMAAGVEINAQVTIVAHPQSNAEVDRELNDIRTQFGNQIIPMHDAARPLVRALSTGGTVAFLVDQHADKDRDPWIEFFGRPTPTYEAPAALALRFNAPIFYAFAVRQPDGRYVAELKRLPMEDLDTSKESAVELTRRHVHELEAAIRRHPHLWSWQHRRWRHDPPQNAHDGNRNAKAEQTN